MARLSTATRHKVPGSSTRRCCEVSTTVLICPRRITGVLHRPSISLRMGPLWKDNKHSQAGLESSSWPTVPGSSTRRCCEVSTTVLICPRRITGVLHRPSISLRMGPLWKDNKHSQAGLESSSWPTGSTPQCFSALSAPEPSVLQSIGTLMHSCLGAVVHRHPWCSRASTLWRKYTPCINTLGALGALVPQSLDASVFRHPRCFGAFSAQAPSASIPSVHSVLQSLGVSMPRCGNAFGAQAPSASIPSVHSVLHSLGAPLLRHLQCSRASSPLCF
ncbi:UNVERIFIED_CONTAM: hypothetical protein FKN15_055530 [Acipenser sinensis]